MAVIEKNKDMIRPDWGFAQSHEPMVVDDDTAAGGSWEYTARAKNTPNIEFLRDNFYCLFRLRHT